MYSRLVEVDIRDGAYWISSQDAKKIGLKPADSPSAWIALASLKGVEVAYDAMNQRLNIHAAQEALGGKQRLHPQAQDPLTYAQAQPLSSLMMAYTLNYATSQEVKQTSAQTRFSASGWLPGTLTSSFNALHRQTATASTRRNTRLMSTWQFDSPTHLASLSVGDNITTGVGWSRQVRFGGVHLARNFGLDPQLNTLPRQTFSDTVALPSTVDLYVDGLKQSSGHVTPGQYILETTPTFTGMGQAQVVVTDINGNRKTVSLDLYGTPRMLAQGLSSGSLDMGWMRKHYGTRSADYESPLLTDAGWRYGATQQLTLEAHAEQQQAMYNGGLGAYWMPIMGLGVINGFAVASQGPDGAGTKYGGGYQWSGYGVSFAATSTINSARFADNASLSGSTPLRRSDAVWLSGNVPQLGTFGAGLVRQSADSLQSRYLNLSWSKSLGRGYFTSLSYTRELRDHAQQLTFTLTVPFGREDLVNVQAQAQNRQWNYRHQTENNNDGWRWQVGQSSGSSGTRYADIGNVSPRGEWHIGTNQYGSDKSWYASNEGSIALLGKQFFLLRRTDSGLALVSTDGFAHVPVHLENRLVGETDDKGYLLLTDIPVWNNSKITIDPLGLPPSVPATNVDMNALPGKTQAVLADFGLKATVSAVVYLHDEQGNAVPMGSRVAIKGMAGYQMVGREGGVWLENPPLPADITVFMGRESCHLRLPPITGKQYIQYGVKICSRTHKGP
ncbi:Fimbrial biogenesis outer membrane usher protein [Pseudocitrobacter vendiensis]|uniref:Fimbrial biogenesis outer membrane usher protein n=1 Tax=Pseudocitrobacter vendiensis TaxID=2488306 RepID=A0ABN8T6D8_9ENTR|nr:Fimbrial biogenesis outer membrane usher protein [Pseudocitrobacter vendiensis]